MIGFTFLPPAIAGILGSVATGTQQLQIDTSKLKQKPKKPERTEAQKTITKLLNIK